MEEDEPFNFEESQKYFCFLADNLRETLQDVFACEAALKVKEDILKKYNNLQNFNLKDLKYDERKLMHYQIITHEIKMLENKSKF